MVTGQDSVPLEQNERNIDQVGDFRIGTRVRWTDIALKEMEVADGSESERMHRSFLTGGSVTQIIEVEGFWTSVRVLLDSPLGGGDYAWASPEDLQVKE